MKAYDSGSIRNVAVVGHGGAGKTQLIAALLYTAGATPRLGRVDDGTTVTDYDDEEIARKHTLSASLAWAEWNKTKINFIDTPGMGNFLSDARAGLRVADAALVVVDAVSGVEVQTEKVWAEADALGLPRLVVVNRLDRERSSLDRTLASVREALSRTIIPVQLPIGEERGFKRGHRPGRHEGVDVCVRRQRQSDGGPGALRAERGRRHRARAADRDGGRGRRRADGAFLRGRHAHAGGTARRAAQGRALGQGGAAAVHVGPGGASARPRCSTRWSATCPRPSIGRSRRPTRSRRPR